LLLLALAASAEGPSFSPTPYGNLKQVMHSILLPNSNMILGLQQNPPNDEAGWQNIVNASVAIEESYNLVMIQGRIESNGQPVPVQNADYAKFAKALAPAGKDCLVAALKKSKDAVMNCTDSLTQACDNCHKVFRDQPAK
jgi:cytochrome c556